MAAFRATLEEVGEAVLIVHVRDIARILTAAPRRPDVMTVLRGLKVIDSDRNTPMITALNKIDLLSRSAGRGADYRRYRADFGCNRRGRGGTRRVHRRDTAIGSAGP